MKNPPLTRLLFVGISLISCTPLAFAEHGGWSPSVRISPAAATLQVGQSQLFTATVSGDEWTNSNPTSFRWLVNGVVGGNSVVGTISSSGIYKAPANVPPNSVRVVAQWLWQSTVSTSANVTITAPTPPTPTAISISISPTNTSVQVGQSQQFTATMSGATDTSVNWSVNGIAGGSATVGTISSFGLYTAPASVPSGAVAVTAQSAVHPTVSASASVSITTPPTSAAVSISPTSSSVQVGQSQQFTATVSGSTNTAVSWLVNGTIGGNTVVGTISSSGLYTAPPAVPSGGVTVTAQSVVQSTASASASVSITVPPPPVTVSISPTSSSLQVGQPQQFAATVSGTSNTAVNWLVSSTVGGNTTVGTISSSGLYTAPAAVPSGAVTVTAQSAVQPTATATATVSVTIPPPISVSISPSTATVQVNQSQQFSATVSNASNAAVNWLVSGVLGGNASLGTISSTGLYTAPPSVPGGSVTVTAQSSSNPSSSATASVTITAPVAHSVALSWTASSSSVAGYNVYRGSQSTGPFTKINPSLDTATVYTDTSVVSGQTYYYATTAVDSSNVESVYSNVVQVVIP